MTDPYSILFGLLILVSSGWLFWLGMGPQQHSPGSTDFLYWEQRRRRRHWVSAMIASVGVCAVGAGCFGRGQAWMILWAVTPIFLFAAIGVGLFDAILTHQHFQRRLQNLRRQSSQSPPKEDRSP
jgi:hypothetical protein